MGDQELEEAQKTAIKVDPKLTVKLQEVNVLLERCDALAKNVSGSSSGTGDNDEIIKSEE